MAKDDPNERLKRLALSMQYGDEMHELVRRLAEKYAKAVAYGTIVTPEMRDASKLWSKMQREAEGDE